MIQEFRTFVARGNVLDLAIAVIIGAAFGKIVSSLTDDVIMPVLGALTGGLDFTAHYIRLGAIPAGFTGDPADYAALKTAGDAMIGYGSFLTACINFVIVAFCIFLLIKAANRASGVKLGQAPATPEDTLLLRDIRDAIKHGSAARASGEFVAAE